MAYCARGYCEIASVAYCECQIAMITVFLFPLWPLKCQSWYFQHACYWDQQDQYEQEVDCNLPVDLWLMSSRPSWDMLVAGFLVKKVDQIDVGVILQGTSYVDVHTQYLSSYMNCKEIPSMVSCFGNFKHQWTAEILVNTHAQHPPPHTLHP